MRHQGRKQAVLPRWNKGAFRKHRSNKGLRSSAGLYLLPRLDLRRDRNDLDYREGRQSGREWKPGRVLPRVLRRDGASEPRGQPGEICTGGQIRRTNHRQTSKRRRSDRATETIIQTAAQSGAMHFCVRATRRVLARAFLLGALRNDAHVVPCSAAKDHGRALLVSR